MTVEILGEQDIKKIFDEIAPKHARNLTRATVQGIAREVAKEAKKGAPVGRTGNLKKSIKAKRKKSNRDRPISVVHAKGAFYWRFVEYGTGGPVPQEPNPFITRAYEKVRANYKTIFREQFGKKLESLLKREKKKSEL